MSLTIQEPLVAPSCPERPAAPDELTEREFRARILEAAALELDVRGWCQGVLEDPAGKVCLVGAICQVTQACLPFYVGAYLEADCVWCGTTDEAVRDDGLDRAYWNDHYALDAEDVKFILRWRAQEIRDGR